MDSSNDLILASKSCRRHSRGFAWLGLPLIRPKDELTPISSLPTEVITIIFSFLCLPATSLLGEKPNHHLVWQPVAHVCHQWREIAINQPLLWSHIDFNKLTLAGVIEILTRAKEVPLHLIARFTGYNDYRFHSFKNVLQLRVSHICHLTICTEASYSRSILEELASPAPNLEYLSLSYLETGHGIRVPDTLFDRTTPRLSCLELHNFDVSWRSPLLKGLRYLKIHSPSNFARPSLADWLDTLEQLPQLEGLVLHSASPIAPPHPFDVGCIATLPFLTHLDISASAGDCAFALAHLALPVITCLCVAAWPENRLAVDAQILLPYVARHAYGPQDTQPLQSVLIRGPWSSTKIIAWPEPDIVVEPDDTATWRAATLTARVALSVSKGSYIILHSFIVDAIAALPLHSLATLTSDYCAPLAEQFWLRHAPRWPCSNMCVSRPVQRVDSARCCCCRTTTGASAHCSHR